MNYGKAAIERIRRNSAWVQHHKGDEDLVDSMLLKVSEDGIVLAAAVEELEAEVERLRNELRQKYWAERFIVPGVLYREAFVIKHDHDAYRLIFGQPFTGENIESPEVLKLIYGRYWR